MQDWHYLISTVEVQPYNHIGSSQLQALDPGMENSHFYGYPTNGDLMDGPYIPEHFAGKLITGYYFDVHV